MTAWPHFFSYLCAMTLHIFNPGHDEALAAGTPYYTHTLAARTLCDALWRLPSVWAETGDMVVNENRLATVKIDWATVERIEPWGWDAALVHKLRRAGAPPNLLPSEDTLNEIRAQSSRLTATNLLAMLPRPVVCESCWCTDIERVEEAVAHYGRAMLKAPWSSSGRGVFAAKHPMTVPVRQRCEKIIATQGAVEVEPFFERVFDLALEFNMCGNGKCEYLGLSYFLTNERGEYRGNDLRLSYVGAKYFESFELKETIAAVSHGLSTVVGNRYVGPVGVDMMLFMDKGHLRLHPCIEVNLRRTMGWVALQLCKGLSQVDHKVFALHAAADGSGWSVNDA